MRRNSQLNPMRMFAMLAVLWAAGTWLFASENPQRARRAEPATPVVSQTIPVAALAQQSDASSAQAGTTPAEDAATATTQPATPNATRVPDEAEEIDPEPPPSSNASPADKRSTPQRFVPSEQVRADFDVSFPIDI